MAQAGKCQRKRGEIQAVIGYGEEDEVSDFDSVKRLKVENDVDRRPVNDEYSLNSSTEELSLSSSGNVKSQHQCLLTFRRGLDNETTKDLKVKFYSNGFASEINGNAICDGGFRESCSEIDEIMDSSSKTSRKSATGISLNLRTPPTAAEIDEFFSAAEKEDRTRFMNKYNFDVVKDIPLAGKYEWVQIKP